MSPVTSVAGFDRFGGAEGLRACCLAKSVLSDRWPWAGIRTSIPPPLQYPMTARALTFTRGMLDAVYEQRLTARVAGVVGIVRAMLARE